MDNILRLNNKNYFDLFNICNAPNCNDIDFNTFFSSYDGQNKPTSGWVMGVNIVLPTESGNYNKNYKLQIVTKLDTNDTYTKTKFDGTWTNWKHI